MACNHCGGSTSIRVERASTGSRSVPVTGQRDKIPLRPLKQAISRPANATIRVIRPANHLDKRM